MEEIGEANFRRPKIRKQVRLIKSLSDNSLNSLIEKEEFSKSEAPQRNEYFNGYCITKSIERDFYYMKFTSLEAATQRCS